MVALLAATLGGGAALALSHAGPASGASVRRAAPRIVGGTPSAITAVPYQVALIDVPSASDFDGQYCGGAIIDATHVVSAAHCVYLDDSPPSPKPAADIRVLAGTPRLRKPGDAADPAAVTVGVASVHADPAYSQATDDHDTAVLTLAQPLYTGSPTIDGTSRIAPIALQSPDQAAAGLAALAPVTISGWGYTAPLNGTHPASGDPNYPQDLMVATQHLVSDADCQTHYGAGHVITANMICAGGGGEPSACFGDSGGPLMAGIGGTPALAGVVSFGIPCRTPGYPDVYTRLSSPAESAFLASALASGGPPSTTTTVATTTTTTTTTTGTSTTTPADTRAPVQQLVRSRCTPTACVFNVQAADLPPSAGLRGLYALQHWTLRHPCAGCPRRGSVRVAQRLLGAGRFTLTVPRLHGRSSTVTVRAQDRAAHRAYRATILQVPRRRAGL